VAKIVRVDRDEQRFTLGSGNRKNLLPKPTLMLLWIVLFGGTVITGITELYFPSLKQARWGVVLAAVVLSMISLGYRALIDRSIATNNRNNINLTIWALSFFIISVLAEFINNGLSFNSVIGIKGYFQVWGIFLSLAFLPFLPVTVDRMMGFLLWLTIVQIPFVLQQHFILVPQRIGVFEAEQGIVAQDVVVGTFVASIDGGGTRTTLGLLLATSLAIATAKWRSGYISTKKLAILSVICLFPIALNGLKFSFLSIPLTLIIVYGDQLRRNLLKLTGVILVSVVGMVILFNLVSMLPRTGGEKTLTTDDYFAEWVSYNFEDQGYGNSLLNRTTVYPFWLMYHQTGGGVWNTLLGYGPGTSMSTNLMEGSIAKSRYVGYGIDLTGLSGLLWEVGILGTISAIGFFVSAFRSAHRLTLLVPFGSMRWIYLKGAEVGIAMAAISLLHNSSFLFEIGFQTLLMLLIGYVFFTSKNLAANR